MAGLPQFAGQPPLRCWPPPLRAAEHYERGGVQYERQCFKLVPAQISLHFRLHWTFAGNYAKALSLYQRALSILEKDPGKDHPDTATCLTNIANLHQAQGDYAKALPLFNFGWISSIAGRAGCPVAGTRIFSMASDMLFCPSTS